MVDDEFDFDDCAKIPVPKRKRVRPAAVNKPKITKIIKVCLASTSEFPCDFPVYSNGWCRSHERYLKAYFRMGRVCSAHTEKFPCERPLASSALWCKLHYSQMRLGFKLAGICSTEDCGRGVDTHKDFCSYHAMKFRTETTEKICIVDDCENGVQSKNLCLVHYRYSYKYKITPEQLVCLLRVKYCESCGADFETTERHIDHSHIHGHVRGATCRECNLVLGLVKDNIVVLEQLIIYLNKTAAPGYDWWRKLHPYLDIEFDYVTGHPEDMHGWRKHSPAESFTW